MTEREFHELCDRALRAIEDAIDASGVDVESSRSGNVLELEFDDGSKVIVNGNTPLREIWVAAKSGGFHFRRDAERWVDTRSGEDLFACLSRVVSQQGGAPVLLGSGGR